jgi:hypothetical protein
LAGLTGSLAAVEPDMTIKSRLLSVFAVPLLLGGTALADDKAPSLEERLAKRDYALGETVERIPDYRVDGWNYVDREHVIISGGVSRRYLLTLMTPCTDLSNAESIGFTSTGTSLTKFDTLVVGSAIGPQRCAIKSIHALDRLEDEAAAAVGE